MKRIGFCTLAVLVMAAGVGLLSAAQDEAAVKKGLEKLQGKWEPVSVTADGKAQEPEELKDRFQVIKGEKATFLFKDKERGVVSMKIDPTKSPAHMDTTYEDGPAKGTTLKGIYKIEGDTMTLCLGGIGKDRPTEFASKPGSGTILIVQKRVK
jgi:uncharacterized protein (TIGR03067 family)